MKIKHTPRLEPDRSGWQDDAACQGMHPNYFYRPQFERRAQAFCLANCPVIDACREHALTYPEPYGVWGGTTEDEREAIWKRQRRRKR